MKITTSISITLLLSIALLIILSSCRTNPSPGPDPVIKLDIEDICPLPQSLKGDSTRVGAYYAEFIKADYTKSKLAAAIQSVGGIYSNAISSYRCNVHQASDNTDSINQAFNQINNTITTFYNELSSILLDTSLSKKVMNDSLTQLTTRYNNENYGNKTIGSKINATDYKDFFPSRSEDIYIKRVEAGLKIAIIKVGGSYKKDEFLIQAVPGDLIAQIAIIPQHLHSYVLYKDSLDGLISRFINGYNYIASQIIENS